MTDSLAIITVTYENYALTDDLIACFRKQVNPNFGIYVVDTSKHKKDTVYPDYVVTIPSLNKGYANAVNIGIKAALCFKASFIAPLGIEAGFPKKSTITPELPP